MKVLLTNDDGIRADGLISLAKAMAGIGEVVVVAPESQQSAVGHSITLHKPIRCIEDKDYPVKDIKAYYTNGTPTDAVLLGMHAVFNEKPDVIVSGINSGPNLGGDVTYSGTVAAAMEGVIANVPSISASMSAFDNLLYDDCAMFLRKLTEIIGNGAFPNDTLLNVNYPNIPRDDIKGLKVTRLGQRWYEDVLHKRVDPRGIEYFWITGKKVTNGGDPGSDAFELDRGYISITPLSLDLTNENLLGRVRDVLSTEFNREF